MFDDVLAAAETLLERIDPAAYRGQIDSHLRSEQAIHQLPAGGQDEPIVCVDGAVAHDQADALTWIAAVGVSSDRAATVPATMVLPVTTGIDRTRSMLMALCEMAAALEVLDQHGEVWLDGSLATPLISVGTGLLVADESASRLVSDTLTQCNADVLIGDFVHYATLGRIRAMPKQDTASGFCELWAAALDGPAADWLAGQRDRTTVGGLLRPGEYLLPRPAHEALQVTAKVGQESPDAMRSWAAMLNELLDHWRSEVDAYVTYMIPAVAGDRAVKIEYTMPAEASPDAVAETAGALAARASSTMVGARIREPLPQHVADTLAKREVTVLIDQLTGAASSKFRARFPSAVTHYRT